ncbi:MAG TPA: PilN domain-containing protein [Stellaceae bacterium]|nr:PilN domain-containing protein [Stellaceae bacterium]
MFQVDRILDWQSGIEPALRGALRWWLGELASFAPAGLRRRMASLRSRLLLVSDALGTSLVLENGEQRQSLGPVDLASPRSVQRALSAAPQARGGSSANVVLCVPANSALRTSVTLPLAAERNLDQVVGFELERLVPFKRDAAYYAHRIIARNKAARHLQVELTVVRRAELDAAAQAAQRVGLHATGIEIAGANPADPATLIPLEGTARPAAHAHARIALAALAGVAALLVVAAIAIPFLRIQHARNALVQQVTEARREAEASLDLQKQIDAQLQDQNLLIDRRRQTPTVTELLDVITRLTPDNTFLTELQIGNGEVHLIGASISATALLGLVDQSPSFRNAAFRSSITQDAKLNRERFDISAKIAPKAGQ